MSDRNLSLAGENIALIKSIYAAFARGDVPSILASLADDTKWDFAVTGSDVPWHAPVTGADGVPRFLGALIENVTIEAFEPRHFIAADDDVVVQVHFSFTVKKNGRHVSQDQLHWWTVRSGKVGKLRHFEDTAQVISAWRG